MERKWLALTPGDSLPLRLGAKVPTSAEIKKMIKGVADVLTPVPQPMRWVDGPSMGSDYAHKAAPDCKNKTRATIAKKVETEFDKWLEGDFEPMFNCIGADLSKSPAFTAWTFVDHNGIQQIVSGAPTDVEVRDFYKRAALGRVSEGERSVFEDRVVLRTPQRKFEQENLTATEVALKVQAAEKKVSGLQMLMEAEARETANMLTEMRRRGTCPGCGVSEGAKHFLSCWMARPGLLHP